MLLIGATGFQFYKHTCIVHNFTAVSFIENPVCPRDHQVIEETDDCCNDEVEVTVQPSCCEAALIDESNHDSITSQEIKCCITSIESNQLQDILLTSAEKKNLTLDIVSALVPYIENEIQKTEQNLIIQNNNLPPPKFGKQLLQTIHQLKLDIPFC